MSRPSRQTECKWAHTYSSALTNIVSGNGQHPQNGVPSEDLPASDVASPASEMISGNGQHPQKGVPSEDLPTASDVVAPAVVRETDSSSAMKPLGGDHDFRGKWRYHDEHSTEEFIFEFFWDSRHSQLSVRHFHHAVPVSTSKSKLVITKEHFSLVETDSSSAWDTRYEGNLSTDGKTVSGSWTVSRMACAEGLWDFHDGADGWHAHGDSGIFTMVRLELGHRMVKEYDGIVTPSKAEEADSAVKEYDGIVTPSKAEEASCPHDDSMRSERAKEHARVLAGVRVHGLVMWGKRGEEESPAKEKATAQASRSIELLGVRAMERQTSEELRISRQVSTIERRKLAEAYNQTLCDVRVSGLVSYSKEKKRLAEDGLLWTLYEEVVEAPAKTAVKHKYAFEGCWTDQHLVTTASAAGGAVLGGASGGSVGFVTGSAIGVACGIVPAAFTFGLSIPLGFAIGGGTGLCVGAAAGATTGAVGGAAIGYHGHAYRAQLKGVSTRLWTTVNKYSGVVKGKWAGRCEAC